MLRNETLKADLLKMVVSFLIVLAPLIIGSTNSLFYWGEPTVPDHLK